MCIRIYIFNFKKQTSKKIAKQSNNTEKKTNKQKIAKQRNNTKKNKQANNSKTKQ